MSDSINFTKEEFQKIWEAALPFQDKRDDVGHAEIVTKFAIKLCESEQANCDVVIPAAILHDIGWSQLSEKEKFLIFNEKASRSDLLNARFRHQEEGIKLAREILNKVNYPSDLSEKIIEIVSQHDTRKDFLSKEDGIMRDADKLWRFCRVGFDADIRRRKIAFDDYYNRMERKIEEEDFFFSELAKSLAREELFKRKQEFETEIRDRHEMKPPTK